MFDNLLHICAAFVPIVFSFLIGRSSERKTRYRYMYEKFYFPMYLILEKYIEDPSVYNEDSFSDLYKEMGCVFQSSTGAFPWKIYMEYKSLTATSFLKFCNYFYANFIRCKNTLGYTSFYSIPIGKEKKYLILLLVSFTIGSLFLVYLLFFGKEYKIVSVVMTILATVSFFVSTKTIGAIDFLTWPEPIEQDKKKEQSE